MIRINLSESEKFELKKIRRSGGYLSERALCVILNSEGLSPVSISKRLHRSYLSVRGWLLKFKRSRLKGLERRYSSGRPARSREKFKSYIGLWLKETPEKYGFIQQCWTKKLMLELYKRETGKEISEATAERALNDAGFSYKRPKKTLPVKAPSKEEKAIMVENTLNEIKEILRKKETEVFALDESHFSTEPYLIKGWSKRGERFFPSLSVPKTKSHNIWGVEYKKSLFLLEKLRKWQC